MPKRTTQNRASSCAFTSAHGRQCTMPRATSSEYCYHHDRKLRYSKEAEEAALEIFEPISGNFIPAHALTESLARLFARVADGRISPNQASAMSKVADVMLRSISRSTSEFKDCFRPSYFQQLLRKSYGELPDYERHPLLGNRRVVPQTPRQPAPSLPAPTETNTNTQLVKIPQKVRKPT
jgi:hypothetical protein